jgi:hypothetical protein
MNSRFDYTILDAINNAFRAVKAAPLVLGGVVGSGGGGGGPIGGFVGHLPQTRVSYDLSELAASGTPASGMSLLDNLNHIRYTIANISGGSGGSPLSVEDEGSLVSSGVTVLNFVGNGVVASEASAGIVTIAISGIAGSGGSYTESITPPSSPDTGDRWFNTQSGVLFTYVGDDDSSQWVELASCGYSGSGIYTVSGTGHTIQSEGVSVSDRTYLDFVGSGVYVTDSPSENKTIITISGGGGSSPATDCVYASYNTATAQEFVAGAVEIIDFDTKVEDTDDAVTTGASWKFTAPTDGVYTVTVRIMLKDSDNWVDGEFLDLRLTKGGSTFYHLVRSTVSGTPLYLQAQATATLRLAADEYISVNLNSDSTGGTLTLINNAIYNSIEIVRIGS